MIGREISHYRVLERLGGGGMGEVFKAEDLRLERRVALKFLPPELGEDPVTKERFVQEAKAASALDHPNLCTIHDIDETEKGRLFIAMTLYEGETLKKRLAGGPLAVDEALEIAEQVTEGLIKAHREGITHRDIKPANLMITRDGVVKIVDFGLAKLAGDPGLTKTGASVGTPAYMSPEQARGEEVDHRTDLWSLGVVLYEMLAGRRPFQGDSNAETLHAVLYEDPPDLASVRSGTPPTVQRLLDRLLAREPKNRCSTAREVVGLIRTAKEEATAAENRARKATGPADAVDAAGTPTATWPGKTGTESVVWGRSRKKLLWLLAAVGILAAVGLGIWRLAPVGAPGETTGGEEGGAFSTGEASKPTVAVLPLANLSPDPENEFFAAGIHEDILSQLARIRDLEVISRTSVLQYADTDQSLPEIAEELGAEAILEGSVRRAGNQIRVVAQLIDAREDAHLWTETYDRELTVENVFAIQSDIAGRISSALQAEFTSEEERRISSPPTEDLEAYDYYLRGVDFLHRSWTERDNRIAIEMFEEATQLDPEFARAWAKLSEAHSRMYWYPFDRSRERLRRAKRAADRSLELEPDLPEGHQALGWYHYWGHLDYQKAMEHFEAALRRQPGNRRLLMAMGAVERRRGNLEETLSRYESALELDPRGLDIHAELAVTHRLLRNYRTAERHFDRALAIAPDRLSLYGLKAGLYLLWKGDTSEARRVLEGALARGLEIVDDRYAGYQWVLVALLDHEYETALERLSSGSSNAFSTQYYYIPEPLLASQVYDLMGSRKAAREQYASAASVLESRMQESPEDARLYGALGIAYAGLGRAEEAIRTGEKGVELLPVSVEMWKGLYRVEELALIYTMTGRLDEAIEQLEYLLSVPAEVSVPLLRLDPRWDPLRDHPRFQALLERHE